VRKVSGGKPKERDVSIVRLPLSVQGQRPRRSIQQAAFEKSSSYGTWQVPFRSRKRLELRRLKWPKQSSWGNAVFPSYHAFIGAEHADAAAAELARQRRRAA